MGIYRGIGGTGDSNTDATITEVTEKAAEAGNSATASANSASAASTSASGANVDPNTGILTLANGQRISPQDPNFQTFLSQEGLTATTPSPTTSTP